MVSLLLDKGATINAYDKKDRRAIHWAAYMGHVEVVKILVEHGAELNCRDKMVRKQHKKFRQHPPKKKQNQKAKEKLYSSFRIFLKK